MQQRPTENQRLILLNPGPVTLTARVRNALVAGDWCHREPEFAALLRDINLRLTQVHRQPGTGLLCRDAGWFRYQCRRGHAGQLCT